MLRVEPNVKKVIQGLFLIGSGLVAIPDILMKCHGAEDDIFKIQKSIYELKDIKSLAFHVGSDLVINHVQIWDAVKDLITTYQKGDWTHFGIDMGIIVEKLFVAPEDEDDDSDDD